MSFPQKNAKLYLQNEIAGAKNQAYERVMQDLLSILWEEKMFSLINTHKFSLKAIEHETREQVIKICFDNMDRRDIRSYITKFYDRKEIHPNNIADFLESEEEYFLDILHVVGWDNTQLTKHDKEILLCKALKNADLEKKLLETPFDNDIAYWLIIHAYMSNGDVDKALELHQKIGLIHMKTLDPLRLCERVIEAGHIDKICAYILQNPWFRDDFNWGKNWNFEYLQKLFAMCLQKDVKKTIDFFTKPELVAMRYRSDCREIIHTLLANKIDGTTLFAYLTSEAVTASPMIEKLNRNYDMLHDFRVIYKTYGWAFLKKILAHNEGKRGNALLHSDWKEYNYSLNDIESMVAYKLDHAISACLSD